jgi:small subunit ribosomal protein S20
MKTFIKKFEESVKSGNKEIAKTNFILAESAIAKTSQKGTLPKNTASRKIAKLSAKLKALA